MKFWVSAHHAQDILDGTTDGIFEVDASEFAMVYELAPDDLAPILAAGPVRKIADAPDEEQATELLEAVKEFRPTEEEERQARASGLVDELRVLVDDADEFPTTDDDGLVFRESVRDVVAKFHLSGFGRRERRGSGA